MFAAVSFGILIALCSLMWPAAVYFHAVSIGAPVGESLLFGCLFFYGMLILSAFAASIWEVFR